MKKKQQKSHTKTINLKYLGQCEIQILNCHMDHIFFLDIEDYFEYIMKKHDTFTDNL